MFADPVYGGNKDFVGWRLVGFPGRNRSSRRRTMAKPRSIYANADHRHAVLNCAFERRRITHHSENRRRYRRAGAAGGIIAAELTKAGTKVIALERGPRLKTEDFMSHDELRYFQRQDLRPNPKTQPVTWRPNKNTRARPLDSINYGNQAGGGTVHYGAVSWRFHEGDFRVRSQTIERYGASVIPEDLLWSTGP